MNLKSKKLRIAMAWWGTWGHVFPIQSLINHILKYNQYNTKISHIFWFGKKKSLEHQTYHKLESYTMNLIFIPILSGKYRRETPFKAKLKNIIDMFLFVAGIFQSIFYLIYYQIDVVFCKWWYVALPVVIAAKILRKKIIIHESDTRPWLVNKIAARFAKRVFTWFNKVLPHSTTVGQILSDSIIFDPEAKIINPELQEIIKEYNPKKTYVLITWWSQGSTRLYKSFLSFMDKRTDVVSKFVFILVLWVLNNDIKPEFSKYKNVHVFNFLSQQEMGTVYHYCDIALTRAGTTSLAEQKLYDMKLFIVPISWTHDQYENAKYYVNHYQDLLIDQKNSGFEKHLWQAFGQFAWFHKTPTSKDLWAIISKAKDVILESIIN